MPSQNPESNAAAPSNRQKLAAMPEEAEEFITDMITDVQEGFQPEATTNFEATALHGLRDITAASGRVVCTLPVRQRVQNRYKTLHGGCIGEPKHHSCPKVRHLPCCQLRFFCHRWGCSHTWCHLRAGLTHLCPAMGCPSNVLTSLSCFCMSLHQSSNCSHAQGSCLHLQNVMALRLLAFACRDGLWALLMPPVIVCHCSLYANMLSCSAATLVDVIGSAAIMTIAEHSGVSLQISIDYLSELPGGEECEATATVSHLGKSTATASVDLRVKRTGRLAARGTHVKFLASGLPSVRSKL